MNPEDIQFPVVCHYKVIALDRPGMQSDIEKVLSIHDLSMFTFHLEVETYTWEVLPEEMRLPINDSIVRELQWVLNILKHESTNKAD